jgi:pterin-4a-carbinolamine dehydratase
MLNGNAKHRANFLNYSEEFGLILSGKKYIPATFIVAELITEGYRTSSEEFYQELASIARRFIHHPSLFSGDVLFVEVA